MAHGRTTAVALLSSAVVGLAVARLTGLLALANCPRSIPADAHRVTKVRIDHLHVDWAGCATIVPLAPTYLGLGVLLLLAVWARWE